ncbi:MAG: HipA domain-containing protein, partial [Treponema sp.]|nr:HipA domain-containing protein [Treponema sp.]
SPAYDINPVPRQKKPNFHALSINHTSSEGLIETAFSVIEEFRINKKEADSIYKKVNKAVSEWKNTAIYLGISKKEIKEMESAFLCV